MYDVKQQEQQVDISQYLTFLVDEDIYAIDVMKTREVLEHIIPTKLPKTPDFMTGAINLRGNVIPIIDLRKKLDFPDTEKTVDTSIIIIETYYKKEELVLGITVDAVKEVIKLKDTQISPPPRVGMNIDTQYIKATGKLDEDKNFIIILNIDRLFADDDIKTIVENQNSNIKGKEIIEDSAQSDDFQQQSESIEKTEKDANPETVVKR